MKVMTKAILIDHDDVPIIFGTPILITRRDDSVFYLVPRNSIMDDYILCSDDPRYPAHILEEFIELTEK